MRMLSGGGNMTRPLLEVSTSAVSYGDVHVVWQADLSVAEGAIVALVGSDAEQERLPSCGLYPACCSRRVAKSSVRGRARSCKLAVRFREAGFDPCAGGAPPVSGASSGNRSDAGPYLRTERDVVSRDMERVFTLFPRLRERRRQDASTLSGGEQQMCAIGRGLMAAPRLLLIDECRSVWRRRWSMN